MQSTAQASGEFEQDPLFDGEQYRKWVCSGPEELILLQRVFVNRSYRVEDGESTLVVDEEID